MTTTITNDIAGLIAACSSQWSLFGVLADAYDDAGNADHAAFVRKAVDLHWFMSRETDKSAHLRATKTELGCAVAYICRRTDGLWLWGSFISPDCGCEPTRDYACQAVWRSVLTCQGCDCICKNPWLLRKVFPE